MSMTNPTNLKAGFFSAIFRAWSQDVANRYRNAREAAKKLSRQSGLAPRPDRPHRQDQEFLPADLVILETPPSPVRMAFIVVICAFVVVAITWSYFSKIDIIANAQGKFQPTGRVKVIQPLETGKVEAVRVENGAHVKAGDLLVEMERGDATAEETGAADALASYRAEVARRSTAVDLAIRRQTSGVAIVWRTEIPQTQRMREQRVLDGDLAQLAASVASFDAQIKQKEAERDRLDATVKAQQELLATLKQRVDMRATLAKSGSGSKADLINAIETQQNALTQLETMKGQRVEAEANREVLAREREKTFTAFISENGQKLSEAQRQVDEYEQRLAKAALKSRHMALTSPIDGVVLGLTVTTVGQVLTTGDEIMRIVPDDGALEIECYLPNKDIGFVRPGQAAVIKVEAFPFTKYGSISAEVVRVAHDAIPMPDATQTEGNPTKGSREDKMFAGAQRTQNLVFPVTLRPSKTTMDVDGLVVRLSPGMAVNVEVATGRRRILEYIFSPMVEVVADSLKER